MCDSEDYEPPRMAKTGKQSNILPIWGNEQTMNLNPLILANIQGSSYFKVHLFKLKTYHEVVDEIYYQVKHLEPWERGSRKTGGQTGMCGGVRGVGAGGIVSTAFCLLYKLYTLRLTRKQLHSLLQHPDSPFLRALGLMYVRFTQPPADLFDWYAPYLDDEEEVDPRAGGGAPTTIGHLSRQMLLKLDWFSTLFPRIPVPIQKLIEHKLAEYNESKEAERAAAARAVAAPSTARDRDRDRDFERAAPRQHDDRYSRDQSWKKEDRDRDRGARDEKDRDRSGRDERDRPRLDRDRDRNRDDRDKDRLYRDRSRRDDRDRDRSVRDRDKDRDRGRRDRDRQRSPPPPPRRHR